MGERYGNNFCEINRKELMSILNDITFKVLEDFLNIKQSLQDNNSEIISLESQILSEFNKENLQINPLSSYMSFGKIKPLSDEHSKNNNLILKNKSSENSSSNAIIDLENKHQFDKLSNANISFRLKDQQTIHSDLQKKLQREKLKGEIFNRVISNENNEYNIFEGNLSINKTLLEFEDMIVYDFQLKKSTIIISFIYLDLILNTANIVLNKKNHRK